MSQFTAADINKLRQNTGAGMLDCKKALTESNGDFEMAIDWLRKQGQKIANKRSDRETNEGVVITHTNADNTKAYVVCLSCETDFVAKNSNFINLAQQILQIAETNNITDKESLLKADFNGVTVANLINDKVASIGEKIEISRYEVLSGNYLATYIHGNYRIGVLVSLNKENEEIGKNIAMQIAAMNPISISESEISPEIIAREKSIIFEQIKNDSSMAGKPPEILEKIAIGRLSSFFKEQTLLSQSFVKNPAQLVKDYIQSVQSDIKVIAFKRIAISA